jgi:hypothetical protein
LRFSSCDFPVATFLLRFSSRDFLIAIYIAATFPAIFCVARVPDEKESVQEGLKMMKRKKSN